MKLVAVDRKRNKQMSRTHYLPLAMSLSAGLLTIISALLFANIMNVPFSDITRDPMAVTGGKFYFGALSNLGVLIWCGTSAIATFAGFVTLNSGSDTARGAFLVSLGVFTGFLCFDDLFMIHEGVWRRLTGLGDTYLYGAYLASLIAILWRWKHLIRVDEAVCLSISCLFFSVAVISDRFFVASGAFHYLLEDGMKFLGQIAWAVFVLTASRRAFSKQ